MRYKLLGKSGLKVAELCLGTMTFGEEWGWGASKEESKKVFDAYVEAGGNFIDTANIYTGGTSEEFCGDFISGNRDHFVLATKYTNHAPSENPNAAGNNRKNMIQSVEASLKRMKTDYIDLYWVHAWDGYTPVEEIMRGLDDLVTSGKIRYIAVSDWPAWIVSRANTLADLKDWNEFIALQIEYSLAERTSERELIPMAKEFDIAVMPWSPLAGGLLTGKFTRGKGESKNSRLEVTDFKKLSEQELNIAKAVDEVADELGKSSAQVALNWVRQQHNSIPIIGARNEKQLKDNLSCLEFTLSGEQMNKLSEVSKIEMGFPHNFLNDDGMVRNFYTGGFADRIDNHRAK